MLSIGTDLVQVCEVERSIARHGERYTGRLFSERELTWCTSGSGVATAALLAECFSAKEAALKVLRSQDHGLDWRSIEVERGDGGKCRIVLSGRAAQLAHDAGITGIEVSLSHGAGLAMAVAVASSGASRATTGQPGGDTR